MDEDELNFPTDRYHELNKDALLEKLVLACSWYFSVATELRFLADLNEGKDSLVTRPHSDMWHAQGAFIGAKFLPTNWPLIEHLISSYEKYHINTRKDDTKSEDLNDKELKNKGGESDIKSKLMFKKQKIPKKEWK